MTCCDQLTSNCDNSPYNCVVGGDILFSAVLQMAPVLLVQFLCMVYCV